MSTTSPIPRRVPEPFLRAEIATFPIASEKSFHLGLIELDPKINNDEKMRTLWRACESQLAPHTGWSLDRLVAARDRGWFGPNPYDANQPISMLDYLRTMACGHLMPRAGVTEIEESTELTALDAADHYRWLTLSLPEDLLLSSLGVEPAPTNVDLDPPLLVRRLLDLGVAEIHQHVGAGMNFPLLWVSALAAIAIPDITEEELCSPGAPLSEGKNLIRWLLAAAICRCVIAEFLIRGINNFQQFVSDSFLNSKCNIWTPRRREALAAILDAVAYAKDQQLPSIQQLRDLYADIHPTALTLADQPIESIPDAYRRCDPVAMRLDLHGENVGERWFLRKSIEYLEKHPRETDACPPQRRQNRTHDELFTRIFWQTIRIRCQYYRSVVQRPLTGGLQWFIRFYGRLGKLRDPLDSIRPEVSFKVAGKRHRIRALEIRTSISDTPIEIGEQLLSFLRSWQGVVRNTAGSMFEPEMGLIFHFVKDRDLKHNWSQGTPPAFWSDTFAEPNTEGGMDVAQGRYVDYYAQQCRKAVALAELIKSVPSSLWVIRGLDVATDELGIPTWVLAPLFRHILDVSASASLQETDLQPLRLTAHVGEDFRHLLEGMRRIYEHEHYILGGGNGRLGHAIALGVEPQAWAESVGSALMPAEERLWDLVFEWRLYTKYRIRPEFAAKAPAGRIEILVNQVRQLSDHIFNNDIFQIKELAEAHHVLHRFLVPPFTSSPAIEGGYNTFTDSLKNIAWMGEAGQVHAPKKVEVILYQYLNDQQTFQRGQSLIDIAVGQDEVEALNAVQEAMRRGISQRGIVVEVNPSSNLLIGDLLDLRNHPILRLNPPSPEPGSPPPVAIAVGSDDPITFSTELLREYSLLHQAACAAGYPEPTVQSWLESIRQTGMDARFTLAWRPSAKAKCLELRRNLCEYLHEPRKDDVNNEILELLLALNQSSNTIPTFI